MLAIQNLLSAAIMSFHMGTGSDIGRFYVNSGNATTIVVVKFPTVAGRKYVPTILTHTAYNIAGLTAFAWVSIDKPESVTFVQSGVMMSGNSLDGVAALTRHSFSRSGIHLNAYSTPIPPPGFAMEIYCYSLVQIDLLSLSMPDLSQDIDKTKAVNFAKQLISATKGGDLSIGLKGPTGLKFQDSDHAALRNDVTYDFHVTNAGDCEVYTSREDGGLRCLTQSIYLSKRPKGDNGDPVRSETNWQLLHAVPGDIKGPFAVVPHGKARYIVTPAGAVQRMVGVDGKACDKLTTVFDKAKVLAVVHDADEGKRYAFTATHFFEVAEPFVLKPHAVEAIDTTNGRTGLESAFHCGRAVRGLPPMAFPEPKPDAGKK